jgi:hypothetical protein
VSRANCVKQVPGPDRLFVSQSVSGVRHWCEPTNTERQAMNVIVNTNEIQRYNQTKAATGVLLPPPLLMGTNLSAGFVFLLRTNHLTRSRAATESSIEECPREASPSRKGLLICSFILSWSMISYVESPWSGTYQRSSQITQRSAVWQATGVGEERGGVDDALMHEAQRA